MEYPVRGRYILNLIGWVAAAMRPFAVSTAEKCRRPATVMGSE